jgi:hypothetical protein
MSQNESFIDEVSEEVRRDRLYALFRRWAWLAVLIVVVVVGLAAWNEWRKAQARAEAQALGDAIIEALGEGDPASRAAALGVVEAEANARALLGLLAAAETADSEDTGTAAVALGAEASREGAEARWRDLAELKLILLESGNLPPEERIARLEPMTASSGPYRLLALEQTAYALAEEGDTDMALALLRDILADGDTTEGLRQRARQMIVALGGSLDPA